MQVHLHPHPVTACKSCHDAARKTNHDTSPPRAGPARALLTVHPDGSKSPLGYPARHIHYHLLGAHAHMTTMTQPWTTARRHRHDDDGGDVRRGTAHARRAARCRAPRQGARVPPSPPAARAEPSAY
ncbi:hypothetical protein EDB85DRAFT_2291495 [Lactarius pseudohatsudake]|nr:hypothetical protein EDB85DRAFT_2291495 [Lactarius pseudohatsudake]